MKILPAAASLHAPAAGGLVLAKWAGHAGTPNRHPLISARAGRPRFAAA